MNLITGIFQEFWLQISEHLFSRTLLKWLLLQRRSQDHCKFQKPMDATNTERVLLNINYEKKCLNTRCFRSTEIILCKVMLFNILLALTSQKYSEGCSSLSTELLSSVNKNSTIVYIYFTLQLKENELLLYPRCTIAALLKWF